MKLQLKELGELRKEDRIRSISRDEKIKAVSSWCSFVSPHREFSGVFCVSEVFVAKGFLFGCYKEGLVFGFESLSDRKKGKIDKANMRTYIDFMFLNDSLIDLSYEMMLKSEEYCKN